MVKGMYKHYKGDRYEVFGIATHTETNEEMVMYKNTEGRLFVRPLDMFKENVVVNGKSIPRFTYIGD